MREGPRGVRAAFGALQPEPGLAAARREASFSSLAAGPASLARSPSGSLTVAMPGQPPEAGTSSVMTGKHTVPRGT